MYTVVEIAYEFPIFAGLVRDSCESNANTRTFREIRYMNQSETRDETQNYVVGSRVVCLSRLPLVCVFTISIVNVTVIDANSVGLI